MAVVALALIGRASTRAQRDEPEPKAFVTIRGPRGEIVAPPAEFSWRPVKGAVSYRVRISDDDALWPLFVKTTDHTSLVLDPKEVTAISPGRIHIWEVDALGPDGKPIAHGMTRFRLTPADELHAATH